MANIIMGLLVDGDAKRLNTGGLGLDQGMPGVFNSIFTLVIIVIFRLAI